MPSSAPPVPSSPPSAGAGAGACGSPSEAAALTCRSSALSTFETCWFTIGWSTRWPMLPTGPAMRTSASHRISVPVPASARWNCVSRLTMAPTPLPLACRRANSSVRSSVFSKSNASGRLPSPSGTFTLARQWRSSRMSKLSMPGISCAMRCGSFSTSQTRSRGAANERVPSTFTPGPPGNATHFLGSSSALHAHAAPARLRIADQLPDRVVRVAAARHHGPSHRPQRVLERGANGVDASAATLAHPLRAERVEGRRRLEVARLQRRHVHGVRHVVVVEVGCQQRAVLVIGENLVRRGTERVRGGAVHLTLDDLRVDALAAVVHGRVVDDLVRARLGIDL